MWIYRKDTNHLWMRLLLWYWHCECMSIWIQQYLFPNTSSMFMYAVLSVYLYNLQSVHCRLGILPVYNLLWIGMSFIECVLHTCMGNVMTNLHYERIFVHSLNVAFHKAHIPLYATLGPVLILYPILDPKFLSMNVMYHARVKHIFAKIGWEVCTGKS